MTPVVGAGREALENFLTNENLFRAHQTSCSTAVAAFQ
jgi:hypothetical protein